MGIMMKSADLCY